MLIVPVHKYCTLSILVTQALLIGSELYDKKLYAIVLNQSLNGCQRNGEDRTNLF